MVGGLLCLIRAGGFVSWAPHLSEAGSSLGWLAGHYEVRAMERR